MSQLFLNNPLPSQPRKPPSLTQACPTLSSAPLALPGALPHAKSSTALPTESFDAPLAPRGSPLHRGHQTLTNSPSCRLVPVSHDNGIRVYTTLSTQLPRKIVCLKGHAQGKGKDWAKAKVVYLSFFQFPRM